MPNPKATRDDFHHALLARFERATMQGEDRITGRCGDLHDEANSKGHSPVVCSGVMWVETTEGDCAIMNTPPSGTGRSFTICYWLPRQRSKFGL